MFNQWVGELGGCVKVFISAIAIHVISNVINLIVFVEGHMFGVIAIKLGGKPWHCFTFQIRYEQRTFLPEQRVFKGFYCACIRLVSPI